MPVSRSSWSRHAVFLAILALSLLALTACISSLDFEPATTSSRSIPHRPPHRLPRDKRLQFSRPMVGSRHPRAFESAMWRQLKAGKFPWSRIDRSRLSKFAALLGGAAARIGLHHASRIILGKLLADKSTPYVSRKRSQNADRKGWCKLQSATAFRTGLDLSVGGGPSVAALNASSSRYASVAADSWVDWRLYTSTPVQNQFNMRPPYLLRTIVSAMVVIFKRL